ncbi:hypothetical protein SAMN02745136_00948 [Anaerocolumna jejuensis DSM 15929]|uniref:Uncharacterized protein n=1 Tax=Anaerocolumna jejuensis DSM 15929 TaxID=1121322 RepID=A0A1M6MCF3_9FIRM|nr:hypothetical protein [Anaerocolumna jejuensis]SHJ81144.1 hypothetical protein SAMN02745136_00948 [Anaerocolumna jejuensis DSM 15929]
MAKKNTTPSADQTDSSNTSGGDSSEDCIGTTQDYVSGDSARSSSSHQFSQATTDPRNGNKK